MGEGEREGDGRHGQLSPPYTDNLVNLGSFCLSGAGAFSGDISCGHCLQKTSRWRASAACAAHIIFVPGDGACTKRKNLLCQALLVWR